MLGSCCPPAALREGEKVELGPAVPCATRGGTSQHSSAADLCPSAASLGGSGTPLASSAAALGSQCWVVQRWSSHFLSG